MTDVKILELWDPKFPVVILEFEGKEVIFHRMVSVQCDDVGAEQPYAEYTGCGAWILLSRPRPRQSRGAQLPLWRAQRIGRPCRRCWRKPASAKEPMSTPDVTKDPTPPSPINYEMRLPGYGGAGVFLRRTISGDPPGFPAVDIWLLGPEFCNAELGRQTESNFLPDLAQYLFAVAGSSAPERTLPAFSDTKAGLTIDVGSSDEGRVGLIVALASGEDADMQDPRTINFEASRASLADTAIGIAALAGGADLANFEVL